MEMQLRERSLKMQIQRETLQLCVHLLFMNQLLNFLTNQLHLRPNLRPHQPNLFHPTTLRTVGILKRMALLPHLTTVLLLL